MKKYHWRSLVLRLDTCQNVFRMSFVKLKRQYRKSRTHLLKSETSSNSINNYMWVPIVDVPVTYTHDVHAEYQMSQDHLGRRIYQQPPPHQSSYNYQTHIEESNMQNNSAVFGSTVNNTR